MRARTEGAKRPATGNRGGISIGGAQAVFVVGRSSRINGAAGRPHETSGD